MNIQNWLLLKRKEKGLSKNKASILCKMAYSHYCGMESGQYKEPTIETIKKIANGFEVPMQEALYASGFLDDQKQDVEGLIQKELSPILKTEILELLSSKKIIDMLKELKSLTGDDKERALEVILNIIKSYK